MTTNILPLCQQLTTTGFLAESKKHAGVYYVVGHETMLVFLAASKGGITITGGSKDYVFPLTAEMQAVEKLLAATYESSHEYAAEELRKEIKKASRKFSPQACLHLGEVRYLTSSTPIGVNAYGLAFEDATYEIADERDMNRFHHSVIASLKQGVVTGVFDGEKWFYVGAASCHQMDVT